MQGLPCADAFVRGVLGFGEYFCHERYKYISILLAGTRESKVKRHVFSSMGFFCFLSEEDKIEVLWDARFLSLCLWKAVMLSHFSRCSLQGIVTGISCCSLEKKEGTVRATELQVCKAGKYR